MQLPSHRIDDEKLKEYIKARPIPDKLIRDLQVIPLLSENDPIFNSTSTPMGLLRRRSEYRLTENEKHVLLLLSHGIAVKNAAEMLHKAPGTAYKQLNDIKVVLQANTIPHAIGLALRAGLID